MKKTIILFILSLVVLTINAQETENLSKEVKKHGLSISFLGASTFAGISYDGFIKPQINIEAGIGAIGLGGGLHYFFNKVRSGEFNYFLGAKGSYHTNIVEGRRLVTYISIGMMYISNSNLFVSMDIGPGLFTHYPEGSLIGEIFDVDPYSDLGIYGNIRFGIRI